MKLSEFIEWLDTKSGFSKHGTGDSDWKELIDYAECIYDYLTIANNKVEFAWEEWTWGDIEYKKVELSFEEFIYKYENYELKY